MPFNREGRNLSMAVMEPVRASTGSRISSTFAVAELSPRCPSLEEPVADQLDDVRAALGRSFRVDREIGAGGMAVVYLAHDLTSDSPVAIKVLRDALSAVIGRPRFLREVSIASQLDHPRIVRVFSSGEANGVLYAVMPYVAGETLRHRLASQKQLPIADAVRIACEVADALSYAHEKGFIHRDIKPANILLSAQGAVVTDFGIARAISSSADEDTMTTSGIVIGTPSYMAPEQAARDRDLDGRSDIYALGTVLYEMLAGDVPFPGLTSWNALARMVTQPPISPRSLRPSIPVAVERVVMRALERTPADRYHTAQEFRDALNKALSAPSRPTWGWRRIGAVTLALAAIPAAAWAGKTYYESKRANYSFEVQPPAGSQFSNDLRDVSAVSPSGREFIIAATDSSGTKSLWLRSITAGVSATAGIPHTEGGSMAFWSPDGKQIGVFQRRSIFVVSPNGSAAPRQLAATTSEARGGSWCDDGRILYAPSSQSGIYSTSVGDSMSRRITTPSEERGEIGHMWPQALPGTRDFLYFVASSVDSVRGIYLWSARHRRGRRVVQSPASAIYSKPYLLYINEGKLVAQKLDISTASLSGDMHVIADSVAASNEYYGAFSASESGALVFVSGGARDISQLAWMDSAGVPKEWAAENRYIRNPMLSRNGRYLAVEIFSGTDSDIMYQDVVTKTPATLNDGGVQATDPVWSPDNSWIAYVAEVPGGWTIFRQRAGMNKGPEPLIKVPHALVLLDWSKDGESLVLAESDSAGYYHLFARRVAKPDEPIALARSAGQQVGARYSRDGQYLAYVSTATDEPEVYVQRLSPTLSQWCRISVDGGYQVAWGNARDVLYFLKRDGTMMHATIDLAKKRPCSVGVPKRLFPTAVRGATNARSFFDVSPRDGRFLVNSPSGRERTWLNVRTHWLAAANLKP